MQIRWFIFSACFALSVILPQAGGQEIQREIQQKLATVKGSVARNQAALRHYSWTEHTDILHKGEVKSAKDNLCRYGQDGKVQKAVIGTPPKQKEVHGIRKSIANNKKEELTDYMERAASLINHYVPPSLTAMQAAFEAGSVSVGQAGPGRVELQVRNYWKWGDSLVFSFDQPRKALTRISVSSYLDDPKDDVVTLEVSFATLPDGVNYVATTLLNADAKTVQVKVTNSNYQKLAQ